MTKTLTEQWREGTLPTGYYYFNNGKETHAGCYIQGEYCSDDITVLSPVPSYDEYKQLVSKTDKLEKRLKIANKALKLYAELNIVGEEARQALKEMEGVK